MSKLKFNRPSRRRKPGSYRVQMDPLSLDLTDEEIFNELEPNWSGSDNKPTVTELSFDRRHQGPFGNANGGYLAGLLGDAIGERESAVRLHRPVPIDVAVELVAEDGWAAIRNGDRILAESRSSHENVGEAGYVTVDEAMAAEDLSFDMGMFADCFVCGRPGREGLGIKPKLLGDGRFAAVWHPASSGLIDTTLVPVRYLRSALDCPGGYAVIMSSGKLAVTGSLTSRIDFRPSSEESLVIVGKAAGDEGRKMRALTTIYTATGQIVATAEAIWVTIESIPVGSAA